MLSHDALSAIATTVATGLGYLLAELRRRRRERRLNTPMPALVAADGTARAMTVADYERMSTKVAGGIREAILGNIGTLRREVAQVTDHVRRLEVFVRDAIGRAERDREEARQEKALSEEAKHRMHAEITGLHAAIRLLASSVERVEKLWA